MGMTKKRASSALVMALIILVMGVLLSGCSKDKPETIVTGLTLTAPEGNAAYNVLNATWDVSHFETLSGYEITYEGLVLDTKKDNIATSVAITESVAKDVTTAAIGSAEYLLIPGESYKVSITALYKDKDGKEEKSEPCEAVSGKTKELKLDNLVTLSAVPVAEGDASTGADMKILVTASVTGPAISGTAITIEVYSADTADGEFALLTTGGAIAYYHSGLAPSTAKVYKAKTVVTIGSGGNAKVISGEFGESVIATANAAQVQPEPDAGGQVDPGQQTGYGSGGYSSGNGGYTGGGSVSGSSSSTTPPPAPPAQPEIAPNYYICTCGTTFATQDAAQAHLNEIGLLYASFQISGEEFDRHTGWRSSGWGVIY